MSAGDALQRICSALKLADIPYMLSGSFASALYGTKRSTRDIDIVIQATAEQLRAFVEALPRDQYYVELNSALEALRQESMFNVIDQESSWKIDLIIRKSRPFSLKEFSRRRLTIVHGVSLYVTSAEDILVSKLEWAKLGESQRQLEDVAAILQIVWEHMDREYVRGWIRELGLENQWDDACVLAGIGDSNM